MKRPHWTIPFLVLAQANIYAFMTHTWRIPLFVSVVAVIGASGRIRFQMSRNRQITLYFLIALAFGFLGRYGDWELITRNPALLSSSIPFKQLFFFLLFAQLSRFFIAPPENNLSAQQSPQFNAPLALIAVLCCCMSAPLSGAPTVLSLTLLGAFLIPYALYTMNEAPPVRSDFPALRNILLIFILALCIGLGTLSAVLIHRNFGDIDRFVSQLINTQPISRAGLSKRATLDSVRATQIALDATPLLRVESPQAPGYLRGRSFDQFLGKEWKCTEKQRRLPASTRDALPAQAFFPLGEKVRLSQSEKAMILWPEESAKDVALLPAESSALSLPLCSLKIDSGDTVYFQTGQKPNQYSVWKSQGRTDPPPLRTPQRYLQVPEELDPRIRELAESIFAGTHSDAEKMQAITDYFHQNYRYEIGIKIPEGEDALTYFLLEKPPAHCEFFAAGAALLLRLGQVPCRYVTGLMVKEKHPFGGYWLGRGRDAHAWVEAYTPTLGWRIVEATPGGLTANKPLGMAGALWDWFKLQVQKLRNLFAQGVLPAIKAIATGMLTWTIMTWPGRVTCAALMLLFLLLSRRRFPLLRLRRRAAAKGTHYPDLDKVLRQMDRETKRALKLERAPSETLGDFARRLRAHSDQEGWAQQAARWYEAYAAARYNTPKKKSMIESLRNSIPPRS